MIAIANHKGGVGKTTVTINLAHALAIKSKNVLVVDLDSQCNSSARLLSDYEQRKGLYELLSDEKESLHLPDFIHKTKYDNIFCIPNHLATSGLELELIQELDFFKIRKILREYTKKNYEYILLDCPPNMLYFFYSALFASDFCLIPVLATSRDGISGLTNVLNTIYQIREKENPDLNFLRVLINGLDKRYVIHKEILNEIYSVFEDDQVFETIIPTDSKVSQSEYLRKTIFEHNKSSTGARAFRKLCNELTNIISPE